MKQKFKIKNKKKERGMATHAKCQSYLLSNLILCLGKEYTIKIEIDKFKDLNSIIQNLNSHKYHCWDEMMVCKLTFYFKIRLNFNFISF